MTEDKKPILIITYWDEETHTDSLKGLTRDEVKTFQDIVMKQFDKGIKIKVNYRTIPYDDLSTIIGQHKPF